MKTEAWITLALFGTIAGSIATINSPRTAGVTTVQPELATKPAIHLKEGAIKLACLKSDEKAIPDMSTASAVRVGCGVAIGFPTATYTQPTVIKVDASIANVKPVVVQSTKIRVVRPVQLQIKTYYPTTTTSRAVVGTNKAGNTRLLVRPVVRPAFAPHPIFVTP